MIIFMSFSWHNFLFSSLQILVVSRLVKLCYNVITVLCYFLLNVIIYDINFINEFVSCHKCRLTYHVIVSKIDSHQ